MMWKIMLFTPPACYLRQSLAIFSTNYIIKANNESEVKAMKKKVGKFISSTVLAVAKSSANTVCNWRTYQPKVPQKLRDKK